jgi:hypothetical protein
MKYLAALVLLLSTSVYAEVFDHDHQSFGELLGDIVSVQGRQSRVDYPQLIQARGKLDHYLESLSSVSRTSFDGFNKDQQLAFLINTYNGYQLRQVIDHYPIKSIKDVGSFFSSPWSKEFFTLFGEASSLDFVEHQLIRKLFKEPRIHFAVNCASISCPPLSNEAYVAPRLNDQLDAAASNFLNDAEANYLKGKTLYASKIFDWYEEDFPNGVINFVKTYRTDLPDENQIELKFSDYNWNLNKQ